MKRCNTNLIGQCEALRVATGIQLGNSLGELQFNSTRQLTVQDVA